MKTINIFKSLLLTIILIGSALSCFSQGTITLIIYKYTSFPQASAGSGHLITVQNLAGTPTFSQSANTDNSGSITVTPPIDLSPPYQWRVSTLDNCTGSTLYDTISTQNNTSFFIMTCRALCGASVSVQNTTDKYKVIGMGAQGFELSRTLDLGDGVQLSFPYGSAIPNPLAHVYAQGNYSICQSISNNVGCSHDTCVSTTVAASSSCPTDLNFMQFGGTNELGIDSFYLYSNVMNYGLYGNRVTYMVNYGDGNNATFNFSPDSANYLEPPFDFFNQPTHVYSEAGIYNVCFTELIYSLNGTLLCSETFCGDIVSYGGTGTCMAQFRWFGTGATLDFRADRSYIHGSNITYSWNFGDGSAAGTDYAEVHTFNPGTYTVCLTISDGQACQDTYCETITIPFVNPGCRSSFGSMMIRQDKYLFESAITGGGSAPSLTWNFGDGTTSTQRNVVHTFNVPGTYNVCLSLTATNGCTDSFCETITVPGGACNGTPTGVAGLTPPWECLPCVERNVFYSEDVQIENFDTLAGITITSLKVDSIANIPPGLSFSMNPSSRIIQTGATGCITFSGTTSAASGTYELEVYITVTMAGLGTFSGKATEVVDNLIALGILDTTTTPAPDFEYFLKVIQQGGSCTFPGTCQASCNAVFVYTNTQNTYSFLNNSTGANLSYLWTFGAGQGSSTLQNPTHTYTTPGFYTVRLAISNNAGCVDSALAIINVGGTGSCDAAFSYTVNGRNVTFNNTSTNYTSSFWTFGDAGSSTQQNPSHTYSQDGTYQACLTIVDTSGCTDNVCQNILISGTTSQFYCLSGSVSKGNGTNAAFPSTVYLIYNDTALGTLTQVGVTSTDQSGNYQFCNVPVGKYLVKAALNSGAIGYSSYIPTYFGNSLFWAYGTEIFLNNNFQQIDIWLIAGNNPGGPGFVGGYVNQGANKMAGPGDPLEAILIMLLDEFDNPVQYIYSDANGRWDFSGVAYGTYKVYAEVTGLPTYPYFVTISPENETVDNITLVVETTQVISSEGPSLNVNLHSVNLYPNPTNDALHIDLALLKDAELTVSITDIAGKTIIEEPLHARAGNQSMRFELSAQQPGVYFVRIAGEDNFKTFKVMKY